MAVLCTSDLWPRQGVTHPLKKTAALLKKGELSASDRSDDISDDTGGGKKEKTKGTLPADIQIKPKGNTHSRPMFSEVIVWLF